MATKNITMQQKTAGGYDTLYPTANMTNVTGTLAIANGGTGATTAQAALAALGGLGTNGGTLNGRLTSTYAAKDSFLVSTGTANVVGYEAKRTDTGAEIMLGINANGHDEGVYSYDHNKWLVYADQNGNVVCNGKAQNVTGTVAITNGGTGATTASAARSALGAMATSGGTFTGAVTFNGNMIGRSNYTYGTSLPTAGTPGRIFFKKV